MRKDKPKMPLHNPKSPRRSFSSQEDAIDYARHVTENSKRRLAAYNLIERYTDGDYYICISEWYRVGRDNQVYDLIFSSVPFKADIGNNGHLGKFPVLVCDTHAVERVEKVVPSFVWLERAKKRYDVRRDILAAPLDSDSYSIGRVVKRSPEMLNSFSGNEGKLITGKRLSKADFVQIIRAIRITLYDVGPLFCYEKSSLPFFKDKDVFICPRETEL